MLSTDIVTLFIWRSNVVFEIRSNSFMRHVVILVAVESFRVGIFFFEFDPDWISQFVDEGSINSIP